MTEGYLIVATGSDEVSYKKAYEFAVSVRVNDSARQVCLATDKFYNVPDKYEAPFDHIVELPYGANGFDNSSRVDHWQAFYCTPYDKTMLVDQHTLIMSNVDGIWELLDGNDLATPRSVNYQGIVSEFKERFEINKKNELPCDDFSIVYFEKTDIASEFFKMADVISKNWRSVYSMMPSKVPDEYNHDLCCNITMNAVGNNLPTLHNFYYTRISLDNVETINEDIPEDWTDYHNLWLHDGISLKINNHSTSGIVVYDDTDYLTKERFLHEFEQRLSKS